MKKEIAELWADALESGDYPQGTCALNRDDSFCCLGVLCDIYKQKTRRGKWVPLYVYTGEREGNVKGFQTPSGTHLEHVPPEVTKWAKLFSSQGEFVHPPRLRVSKTFAVSLARLNDLENRSFNQIAKIIRLYWETL